MTSFIRIAIPNLVNHPEIAPNTTTISIQYSKIWD